MNRDAILKERVCVVTGAGGFIGSHLVEALLSRGARVRALIHYNALGSIGHLSEVRANGDRLQIVAGDVRDARCIRNLLSGSSVVFHLAALIGIPYSYVAPESYVDTNIRGTLNVLEACRDAGVERLIHTSTSEAYGTARKVPITERHLLQAQSPYSATKIAADKLVESYSLSFSLPVTTLRPFNTYGPRQSCRGVVPTIFAQALDPGCEAIQLGSLEPERDLTFVSDTAEAFCRVAEAPLDVVGGRLYNLGTGTGVAIGRIADVIRELLGCDKPVLLDPNRIRPTASEVLRLVSDPSRIEREVGWKATVGLDTGLRLTADYFSRLPRTDFPGGRYVI